MDLASWRELSHAECTSKCVRTCYYHITFHAIGSMNSRTGAVRVERHGERCCRWGVSSARRKVTEKGRGGRGCDSLGGRRLKGFILYIKIRGQLQIRTPTPTMQYPALGTTCTCTQVYDLLMYAYIGTRYQYCIVSHRVTSCWYGSSQRKPDRQQLHYCWRLGLEYSILLCSWELLKVPPK